MLNWLEESGSLSPIHPPFKQSSSGGGDNASAVSAKTHVDGYDYDFEDDADDVDGEEDELHYHQHHSRYLPPQSGEKTVCRFK